MRRISGRGALADAIRYAVKRREALTAVECKLPGKRSIQNE